MNQRTRLRPLAAFLVLLAPLTAGSPPPVPAGEDAAPPNVLLIVTDDLGTQLGCYGDEDARTPHLDRLAARGVRFERAYCQAPVCNPSRFSFMTGRFPVSTGIYDNAYWPELSDVTLPELFAQAGYETVTAGKIFHPSRRLSGMRKVAPSDRKYWMRALKPARGGRREAGEAGKGKTKQEHVLIGGAPLAWKRAAGEGLGIFNDGKLAESAARYLREKHAKPFFLAVGFTNPHLPYEAPDRCFEGFDPSALALPRTVRGDLEDVPRAALVGAVEGELEEAEWRRALHAYHATVAYIDECVGLLLDTLDETGLAENTIVCFTSDHGQLLGQHGLWRKGVLFEDCVRVPLIVADPRRADGAGKASRGIVGLVDLVPTLGELCGFEAPSACEGTSMAPLLADPEAAWNGVALTYEPTGRSLRTDRYRLTVWNTGEAELYDHATDPGEFTNVVRAPEHQEELRKLVTLLRKYPDVK